MAARLLISRERARARAAESVLTHHPSSAALPTITSAFVPQLLLSSLLYWHDPQKASVRRSIDLYTVRIGMACQVLFTAAYCRAGALPPRSRTLRL